MKKFQETIVEKVEISDIDLEYPFYSGDERNEVIPPKGDFWYDTESIDIDDVI